MDQGRFGLQDRPIPSAYVSSKPLQSHQTDPQPDLTISPAQPYVCGCGTSQGASHGASHSISCGASCGTSHGASHTGSVPHGASLHDPQADGIRIPAVQHPVGAHIVSHDAPQSVSARIVSHNVPQSISDQCSGSSIPILNPAVQLEPSATMTLHRTIAHSPALSSSISSSPDMLVNGTEEDNEEADGEEDIEEDDMYNEGGDFAEDHSIDIDMEHEEDFHGSDNAMQPSYYHDGQTYPTSGNNQVRRPAQAPD
ncbi:hypothetical protein F4604DRAFT_1915876 [Suillus subluteus]|nr:hypothetical protein F4604DRAFT_1915876 [Suillus subluteus]